jgi:hypothetical protein
MLVAILHFVRDDEDPAGLVAAYRDALPAGSHLVLSHVTADFHPPETGSAEAGDVYRESKATAGVSARTRDQVLGLFDGFELVDPGLVQVPLWRRDGPAPTEQELARVGIYGGVGIKS